MPETIFSDGTKLRQAIINLLGNAVKFTQEGFISLSVFALPGTGKTFTLRIEIADSGIGIPEEQHDKIFEAFVQQDEQSTKKYGGTGLGLAITKGIIDKMGGKIELKSKRNSGATFVITLPNIKMTGERIGQRIENDTRTLKFNSQTILTVGKEKETIIIERILHNYNIIWKNVHEIDELFDKIKEDTPKLIIIGDESFSSKDAFIQTTLPMLKELSEIPIIAVVSKNTAKEKMNIINDISKTVIIKPVVKKELIEILKNYLTFTKQEKEDFDKVATIEEKFTKLLDKIADIESFHSDMKWEIYPAFKAASNTKLISKIKLFSEKLENIGNRYQIDVLTELSSQLKDHLKQFNISGMEEVFDKTKNLLRILETTIERG